MDVLDKTCKNGPKQNSDHRHRNLHIRNSLCIKFQRKLKILNLWTKLTQKRCFRPKKEKRKITIHIQISLCAEFKLEQTILILWAKFTQKGYFGSKTEKMNTTIESFIFKLVYVPIFG